MDRQQAIESLRQAIIEDAKQYEGWSDDRLLNQFAIIAHWTDIENDNQSKYSVHFHQEEVPPHIVRGLFSMGMALAGDE